MSTGRREFLKRSVEAAALLAAGATWPGCGTAQEEAESGLTWRKAPCRFCGTGCGTLVGTRGGRALSFRQAFGLAGQLGGTAQGLLPVTPRLPDGDAQHGVAGVAGWFRKAQTSRACRH